MDIEQRGRINSGKVFARRAPALLRLNRLLSPIVLEHSNTQLCVKDYRFCEYPHKHSYLCLR